MLNDEAMSNYYYYLGDNFKELPLLLSFIIMVLLSIGWLILLFRNNAFKRFYPVSRWQLFGRFIMYLVWRLGRAFIDADRELEERLGVSIPTIFELEGEEGFRRRETQLLDELSARDGLVLATGGGAVLSPVNRDMLQSRGRVLLLRCQM